jgi:hypothetical protein
MTTPLRIFTSSEGCEPCQQVSDLLEQGSVLIEGITRETPVEAYDITSDEGFPFVESLGIEGAPAAYLGDVACQLEIAEDGKELIISCPDEDHSETDHPDEDVSEQIDAESPSP